MRCRMHGSSRSGLPRHARSTRRSSVRCSTFPSSCCCRHTAIPCSTTLNARLRARSLEELLDGLAALVAVVAGQLVHVHVDESRRVVDVEVTGETERVSRRLLLVL